MNADGTYYLGRVKWFRADYGYGFIDDYFIHERNVVSGSLNEHDEVIYQLRINTRGKNKGKREAYNVSTLSSDINRTDLIKAFLISNNNIGLLQISSSLEAEAILNQTIIELFNELFNTDTNHLLLVTKCYLLISVPNQTLIDKRDLFEKTLTKLIDDYPDILIDAWIKGLTDEIDATLLTKHYSKVVLKDNSESHKVIEAILDRLTIDQIVKYFIDNQNDDIVSNLKKVLKCTGDRQQEIFQVVDSSFDLSDSDKIELWLDGVSITNASEAICNYYLQNFDSFQIRGSLLTKIFTQFEDQEQHDFITSLLETVCAQGKLLTLKYFNPLFENTSNTSLTEKKFIDEYFDYFHDALKLDLWIENTSDFFDIETFRSYLITLPSQSQKLFLKKCFYHHKQGSLKINLEFLDSIRNSFLSFQEINNIEDNSPDVSTFFVIESLIKFLEGSFIREHDFYTSLSKVISHPKQLLEITGYFDNCKGRKGVVETEAGYELDTSRKEIPDFVIYCEGRRALDKDSNSPAKCNQSGLEFWWCANQKCYQNVISQHYNYTDYTVYDFIQILDIAISDIAYEKYLGYVNKINRFLERLRCASCSNILTPAGQSNYAFYRVNRFSCSNSNCQNHNEEVYLSHCLNGKCGNVVDSRLSSKCSPLDKDQDKCGWYVCNYCHACCNSEALGKRKEIISYTGGNYSCHEVGHLNRGEVCCFKCGSVMDKIFAEGNDYHRILNWFKKKIQSPNPFPVEKWGHRKDGKMWFILKEPEHAHDEFTDRMLRYAAFGFNVKKGDNSVWLISEPFANQSKKFTGLQCPSCGFLDHVMDPFNSSRMEIVNYYHNANILPHR